MSKHYLRYLDVEKCVYAGKREVVKEAETIGSGWT